MASGDSYSQVHTSDIDVTRDIIKTNGPVSFLLRQTKHLVRSYYDALAVDDLWQMFSLYGEVSNIIIDGHGATITYKDQCSFPGLDSYMEMEMIFGDRKVFVTSVSMMDVKNKTNVFSFETPVTDAVKIETNRSSTSGGYHACSGSS